MLDAITTITSKLTINPNSGKVSITSPTGGTTETITQAKTYTQNSRTTLTYTKPIKDSQVTTTNYTITYNYKETGKENTTDTAIKTNTKIYTFDRWSKSTGFKGILSSETANGTYTFPDDEDANSTITAIYTESTTENTTTVTLPTPTQQGYTFNRMV